MNLWLIFEQPDSSKQPLCFGTQLEPHHRSEQSN